MKERIEETLNDAMGEETALKSVAPFTTERIVYQEIEPQTYISTDNLLQDCQGKTLYDGTPNITSMIAYREGDIPVSNIRPYLKEIWQADCKGGYNPDVLVFRPVDGVLPKYVYYSMRRQKFFDRAMTDVKGMKMPRGKKDVIENFPLSPSSIR